MFDTNRIGENYSGWSKYGYKILYDINNIERVGGRVTVASYPTPSNGQTNDVAQVDNIVSHPENFVNTQNDKNLEQEQLRTKP